MSRTVAGHSTDVTSGDISSYRVEPDGTLVLLQSIAADTGPLPDR